jgi:hypothetical protein
MNYGRRALLGVAAAIATIGMLTLAGPANAAPAAPRISTPSTVSPSIALGTICVWTAEEVKADSIYAAVSCTKAIPSIFIETFGEDARGDTTWVADKTCPNASSCSGVWKGSSSDVSQTACVEIHAPAILGDCATVKV